MRACTVQAAPGSGGDQLLARLLQGAAQKPVQGDAPGGDLLRKVRAWPEKGTASTQDRDAALVCGVLRDYMSVTMSTAHLLYAASLLTLSGM